MLSIKNIPPAPCARHSSALPSLLGLNLSPFSWPRKSIMIWPLAGSWPHPLPLPSKAIPASGLEPDLGRPGLPVSSCYLPCSILFIKPSGI